MSTLAYEEKYTVRDYQKWEGDWELIYGDAYAMAPSPMYSHQFISLKIVRQLDEQTETCPKCSAIFEMDWEISEETTVRPDTMVICYEPEEKLTKKPEIIFEVISPSTSKRDEILKFDLYQKEGVTWYILVYPDNRKAKVYQLIDYTYRKMGDFSDEHYLFELEKCTIDFDFDLIWRKH